MKVTPLRQLTRHLTAAQIYAATRNCPACWSGEPREAVLEIQADPTVQLLFCRRCGCFSASHLPHAEVLTEYYSTLFKDIYAYYDSAREVTFHRPDRFASHVLGALDRNWHRKDVVRILDFGGGDGSLGLEIARRLPCARSREVVVWDYGDGFERTEENVRVVKTHDWSRIGRDFDLVVASAVIEHVPDPKDALTTLFSLVADGGYFYARTPYMYPFLKHFKGMPLGYPGHLHDMGPQFWNRIVTTFQLPAGIVRSRPSIVETTFRHSFLLTLAAYLLKFPGHVEAMLSKPPRTPLWQWVGGWEVLLKFNR